MIRVRRHRRSLAALLAAVLLLAQFAAAAYACPGLEVPPAAGAAAAMVDCNSHAHAQMDPDQPQLCKAHCDPEQQSPHSGASGLFAAGAAPWPLLLWVLPPADAAAGVEALAFAPAQGPPRGAPPLYLSLLILRN